MRIFDAHFHFSEDNYDLDVLGRNVIFNSVIEYKEKSALGWQPTKSESVTLLFDFINHEHFIQSEINLGKIAAVKIHSRIQKIAEQDYKSIVTNLEKISSNIPIVVDCFYHGTQLEFQPSLKGIILLLESFPDRKFVLAHSGGIKLLEYFFHLRKLSNLYYELSATLQYLHDSSLFTDLKKLISFTDKKRILFGSDFPFTSPSKQLGILQNLFKELALKEDETDLILYLNAVNLFLEK